MKYPLFILITVFFFSSCSFNKMFLQPSKIPVEARKLKITSAADTSYITFDTLTLQPTFLDGDLDTIELAYTIESVFFENEKGNVLNGWFLKPKNSNPDITLLHFHGNAGAIISQYQAMVPLLEHGFQVFTFDYSGFGFSEGKATRKNVLMDGNAALSYLETRADVKNTKLVIYGQSLGGHLSAVVAEQREDEIDGLVIEGAFSSHKDIAAEVAGFIGRMFVSEKYSALESIKEYTKPLLVIHSSEDEIIPLKLGEKIFDEANAPKEFYKIDGCHICGPEYYADRISVKIQRMLIKN